MKARGNCPECHLRDVTHVVSEPAQPTIELCGHCASVFEWRYVEMLEPRR